MIERAVVLCRGDYIEPDELLLSNLSTTGDTGDLSIAEHGFQPCSLDDMEKQHILATLQPHQLEQEPHGEHPGHRALDAGPQDPPLRPGRRRATMRS